MAERNDDKLQQFKVLPEAAAEIRRLRGELATANNEIETLRKMIETMRAQRPQLSDLIGVTCATCGRFVYGEVPDGWIEFGDKRYCSEKCYQERPEKSSPPSPVAGGPGGAERSKA